MPTCDKAMDDLQAVTHALVDNDKRFAVAIATRTASVFGGFVSARFERNSSGSWSLVRASYDHRPVTLAELLASIEEAD